MDKGFKVEKTTISNFYTFYNFVIPDFQREFVWKKSKQQQLLDSILKGFPIGAITLYDNVEERNYLIIDGLQRINTLGLYLKSPSKIISYREYSKTIDEEIDKYLSKFGFKISIYVSIKREIKNWYNELDEFMSYKKTSRLFNKYKELDIETDTLLEFTENLLEILTKNIDISSNEIALIIYSGEKDNLPDLFKNINTGSVALTQYEIFQSLWHNFKLNEYGFDEIIQLYRNEIKLIESNYEVSAHIIESGFDIFKNFVGLNNKISNIKDCDILFPYLKRSYREGKLFENESIAFEIFSTLVEGGSNKVNKAVTKLFQNKNNDHREEFIKEFNIAINESIILGIEELKKVKFRLNNSKYHSLYIVTGVFLANYNIDNEKFIIAKSFKNESLINKVLDIETHNKENWFINENRQEYFYRTKIEELKSDFNSL